MFASGRPRALAFGGALVVSILVAGALGLTRPGGEAGESPRASDPETTSTTAAYGPSDVSVVWVVLDEAPLWPLLGSDGRINASRWPGFAALADASTWYRDTVSPAQWTYFAMPAMLTGKEPTFDNQPVLEDHPDNIFTELAGRVKVNARESITALCPPDTCAPGWRDPERGLVGEVRVLSETVDDVATETAPALHFVHTLLPHRPWHLSVDMRLAPRAGRDARSDLLVDRRRDLYQSMLRQYVATDGEILKLVKRLRASPEWDRTMLIVTADHGITFVPGEPVRDSVNPDTPGTMDDVFRVPLFIKYPSQAAADVRDCTATTMDIVPTVLATVGVEADWDLDGENLARECPQRDKRRVRWPGGRADMTSRFGAVLERVRYYDEWVDADGDADGIFRVGLSGSLVDTAVPGTFVREASVTWSLADAASYQQIGEGRFAPVPVRATGRIRTSRAFAQNEEALVAMNGRFVAVIPEVAGSGPDTGRGHYFNTNLSTRGLRAGPQEIELWIARWEPDGVRLTRVGPPQDPPK